MRGFYLGIQHPDRPITPHALIPETLACDIPGVGTATLLYNRDDWRDGPEYRNLERGASVRVSGWFVYRNAYNDLAAFGEDLFDALDRGSVDKAFEGIQAGAFMMLVVHNGKPMFLTDPLGLHPHYAPDGDPFRGLSPIPSLLSTTLDPLRSGILDKHGHLFGDETAFEGISRVSPGYRFGPGTRHRLPFPATLPDAVQGTFSSLQSLLKVFPRDRPRILPLSGGLDSRLILAAGDFDFGYTMGPSMTGDRPIARTYAHLFREYDEFSMTDLVYPTSYRDAGLAITRGLVDKPFLELLVVYDRIAEHWGPGGLFFDGYAGDALQRFTCIAPLGKRGTLAKLWPRTLLRKADPYALLSARYPSLDGAEKKLLFATFDRTTESVSLDAARRVLLFEIVGGRCARYAITGGTLLSSLFFTPIQPFYFFDIFSRLLGADPEDGMRYRSVRTVWNEVPDAFCTMPTYAGFKPRSHPEISRITLLVNKALAKAGLARRACSYEVELPHLRWKDG